MTCMRFSQLDGHSIGLWGFGRETRSFIAQAQRHLPGARVEVLVLDDPSVDPGAPAGTRIVGRPEAVAALRGYDFLIRSPGVSIYRPEIEQLRADGVRVATATGLWLAERGGRRVVGITGTKGKSTTATLLAHLVRATGAPVRLAGNIGRPALDLIDTPADEWAVVELSSYQIADLPCGPEIAVVTNLYKEHIDWHGEEAIYRRDKMRLLTLDGVRACVIPAGEREIAAAAENCSASVRFGGDDGWHVTEIGIRRGPELVVPTAALPLRGGHNATNLCAALAALDGMGISPPPLPDALSGIASLPHRLETVHSAGGVEWVDDSISTTPESTLAAMAAYPDRDLILIGGGQDRDQDYAELGRVAAARNALVLGLPVTGSRFVAAARAAGVPGDRAVEVPDMEAAVHAARSFARPGAVVLLSPAAPSYNSYRNFEERGDHFAALAADGR